MVTVADTAFSIAVVRAHEAELPEAERLFEDPYAAMFAAAGGHAAEATQRFLDLQLMREVVRLRTRYIDDAVRAAIASGLDQLVLLGAGFDARGMRLPEIARENVAVYEVDFAEQLERKRAILLAGGVSVPERIAYVACDFSTPDFDGALRSALVARGFSAGGGAIFVWEGVIGYIDLPTIQKTLAFMASVGGPRSRAIFTFAQTTFEPETVETAIRRAGFTSCEEIGTDEAWRRYWSSEPHEHAYVARFATAVV